MKNYFLLLLLLLFAGLPVLAQLTDDFSDGDFTNAPSWFGDTDLFQVSNGELQLFNPSPGSANISYLGLAAATSLQETTTWEFYVRQEFAPSASNYARVYLSASNSDLTGDQEGYFLQIGGIAGANDAIELFRQDGGAEVLLLSGTAGSVGADPALARVRVTRTVAGVWELWADYSGGMDFQLEGTTADATYDITPFFGLVCIYTSTRAEAFFFDDVLIDPVYTDQEPPQLLAAQPLSSTEVQLQFNEPLDVLTAEQVANYDLSGVGNPLLAALDPIYAARVNLTFAEELVNQQSYTVFISGIEDQNGNLSGVQSVDFDFFLLEVAVPFDVLINEIMADPAPPVLLPEVEYVELLNRSGKVLDLEGWLFSDGGTPAPLPAYQLLPDSLVLLCDIADAGLLASFGSVIGLSGFPGLNNTGDNLTLRNADGELIHQVIYSEEWYREGDKDDGGWSLELINPEAPCRLGENWIASEDLRGGTPGKPNSVLAAQTDESGISLLRLFPTAADELLLTFDKAVSLSGAEMINNYSLDNGAAIADALVSESSPNEVSLLLSPALQPGQVYTLSIAEDFSDCRGNPSTEMNTFTFGLPAPFQAGDLLIHEVLFNPQVGGVDFVEIFNASDKVLNLQEMLIANISGTSDSIEPVTAARLILPGELLVLTESPGDILSRYQTPFPQNLVANELPVLPDKAGNVTLFGLDGSGEVVLLDAFDYTSDLHNPFLDDENGVSLERIDLSRPTNTASNWQSAAASAGYATPTGPNSQRLEAAPEGKGLFRLPYTTFSPDGDGYFDFLTIEYALDRAGYSGSVRVFDAVGRVVKDLVLNELLPTEGVLLWEGDDLDGQKARIGIYVIWVELVHPEGKVEVIKETCVLAGRF